MPGTLSRTKIARHVAKQLQAGNNDVIRDLAAYIIDERRLREVDLMVRAVLEELEADGIVLVDATATTKGKGFAGVMKRHGFHGVSASHGAHRNHRKPGSIGGASTPGRVFKGMRMAGRMGGERQTTQNLTIHAVDADKGLLLVRGAVPGPRGGVVLLRTAAKGA